LSDINIRDRLLKSQARYIPIQSLEFLKRVEFSKEVLVKLYDEYLNRVFTDLYLHFFNRELYRTIYGSSADKLRISHDRILMTFLIAGRNKFYTSHSAFFESTGILVDGGRVYLRLKQLNMLEVIDETMSINIFFCTKQKIYKHDITRYPKYFTEDKKFIHIQPTIIKKSCATDIIADYFLNPNDRIYDKFPLSIASKKEILKNQRIIEQIIANREDKAITASLFRDSNITLTTRSSMARLIAGMYAGHYVDFIDGDVITGTQGLQEYDFLSKNFPAFDFPIVHELLCKLGYSDILNCAADNIERILDYYYTYEHTVFCMELQKLINFFNTNVKSTSMDMRRQKILTEIEIYCYDLNIKKVEFSTNCFEQSLENLKIINRKINNLEPNIDGRYEKMVATQPKDVFVIYGRNEALRISVFNLLRALKLNPLEWNAVLSNTGETAPYIGDAIKASLNKVAAVIVVLSPDETVKLKDEFAISSRELEEGAQPRPNVILEAGMALGMREDKTIILEFGKIRGISDILGRHIIKFDTNFKVNLLKRLEIAGCLVNPDSDYFNMAINFTE